MDATEEAKSRADLQELIALYSEQQNLPGGSPLPAAWEADAAVWNTEQKVIIVEELDAAALASEPQWVSRLRELC